MKYHGCAHLAQRRLPQSHRFVSPSWTRFGIARDLSAILMGTQWVSSRRETSNHSSIVARGVAFLKSRPILADLDDDGRHAANQPGVNVFGPHAPALAPAEAVAAESAGTQFSQNCCG
jgi:hypothetical protein